MNPPHRQGSLDWHGTFGTHRLSCLITAGRTFTEAALILRQASSPSAGGFAEEDICG